MLLLRIDRSMGERIQTADALAADGSFIAKSRVQELSRRTNWQASVRICVHLGLFATSCFLLHGSVEHHREVLLPMTAAHGALIATFFGPLHECVHNTAFRSKRLNDVVVWLSGLILLLPGFFYREYHFEHHRYTQDPQRDPELAVRPREWPSSLQQWMRLQLRFALVPQLRLLALWRLALAPHEIRPFVRPHRRVLVLVENAIALLIYLSAIALMIISGQLVLLFAWLAAYAFAWVVFLWHTQCEHTGCATTGSQLERTRTMRSNPIWRFLMWNENYHGAHHTYPSVPFHALPALDKELGGQHVNVAAGYSVLQLSALQKLLNARTLPKDP